MRNPLALSLLAAAALAATRVEAQQYLTNGSFESLTGAAEPANTFAGWTESDGGAATLHPGLTGDSAAKLAYKFNGRLAQDVPTPGLLRYQFDVDFALTDPGASGNRGFQINLRHGGAASNEQLNLAVFEGTDGDNLGDVRVVSGGAFTDAIKNVVDLSADADADGLLSPAERRLNHLRIVADYSAPAATYDLYLTNAAGTTFSSLGRTEFQISPAAGKDLDAITFETGNFPQTGSPFAVIDNASLATAALLLTGALARRRRR